MLNTYEVKAICEQKYSQITLIDNFIEIFSFLNRRLLKKNAQ